MSEALVPAPSPIEGRATVRVPVSLPVVLQDVVGGAPQAAQTLDLSPAGAGVVATELWEVGAVLRFRCVLPARHGVVPVDVAAEVRWRSEVRSDETVLARDCFRYGLEFRRASTREEDRIVAAVLYLETRHTRS